MVMPRSRKQRGLTMIEVFIASLILFALLGMASYLLWSSSRNTETSVKALQVELQAREFLDAVTREFHQTKMTLIKRVDTSQPIQVDAAGLNGPATPGTLGVIEYYLTKKDPSTLKGPTPHKNTLTGVKIADFEGVRFKLPGSPLDLTSENAKDFDLAKFKASNSSAEASAWLYEVQYWWEVEPSDGASGSGPKGLVPDGVDNNKDGVIDEGVIYKLETWYEPGGTVVTRRHLTVACRNVKDLSFYIPGQKWTGTDWDGDFYDPDPPRQIVVTVTLEIPDPNHPNHPEKNIIKTVSTVVDVRN